MKNTALFVRKASVRKFLMGFFLLFLLIMIQHCALASGGNCQFDGWVKTQAGSGISGVMVKVYLSDDTYVTQTQTASNGGWSVSSLAEGTYYFTFEKSGWTFAVTPSGKYPITEAISPFICDNVRGAESSTTTAPTITSVSVSPSSGAAGDVFTFTVTTRDATASAIYDSNKNYIGLMEAATSSRYTYDYVPATAGTQTLYFRAQNGIGTLSDYASISITVTEAVAGSLSGLVQDANGNGLQGVTITIWQNGTRITTATTNASGAWSAANLIANVAYNLVASKNGYTFLPGEVQIRASATSTTVQTFVGTPVQEDIPIDEAHFPDDNFRAWCLAQTWGADAVLSADEAETVTAIEVDNRAISNMVGIECFTKLMVLRCSNNNLSSLDITKNTALWQLICRDNQLSVLDVSKNTALNWLECQENQLSVLDVSKNTALTYLSCEFNRLSVLDVSKNTALTSLWCDSNQLSALDVSNNSALKVLFCRSNQLSVLDVSKNTALVGLSCNNNQLSVVDVSKNTALDYLQCDSNQLSALDVSKNIALTLLWCDSNQLSVLDVSKNTALRVLHCSSNQLTVLDVSKNTALQYLSCESNQLSALDLSQNTKLINSLLSPQTIECPSALISVSSGNRLIDIKQLVGENNLANVSIISPSDAVFDATTGILSVPSSVSAIGYAYNTKYCDNTVNNLTMSVALYLPNAPAPAAISFTTAKDTYATCENVTFNLSITSGTRVRLVVDGTPYDEYPATGNSFTATRAFTSSGARSVQFQMGDNASWGAISEAKTITIAAVGTLSKPTVNDIGTAYQNAALSVSWQAVANAQAYVGYLYRNGSLVWKSDPVSTIDMSIPASALGTPGTHSLELIATGRGYDQSSAAQEFEVVAAPDPNAPTVLSFTMAPTSVMVGEEVSFTVSTRNAASIQMYADGQPVVDCIKTITNGTVSFTRAFSQAGIHSIAFEARDDAGNSAMSSEQTITIRPKPPTVTQQTYVTEWRKADGTPCKWTVDIRELIGIANLSKAKDFSWGKYNVSTGILQSDRRPDQVITYTYLTGDAVTPENLCN